MNVYPEAPCLIAWATLQKKLSIATFFICILKIISYNKNRVRIKMTHVGGIGLPLGYLAPDFLYMLCIVLAV